MLKHFNTGVWLYGAQDGSANSGTVARVAAGGGAIAHGVHICSCGFHRAGPHCLSLA